MPVMSLAKMTLHSRPLCFERALATRLWISLAYRKKSTTWHAVGGGWQVGGGG